MSKRTHARARAHHSRTEHVKQTAHILQAMCQQNTASTTSTRDTDQAKVTNINGMCHHSLATCLCENVHMALSPRRTANTRCVHLQGSPSNLLARGTPMHSSTSGPTCIGCPCGTLRRTCEKGRRTSLAFHSAFSQTVMSNRIRKFICHTMSVSAIIASGRGLSG